MNITTKYNIGDKIEFRRESVNGSGKVPSSWIELGIIKSISVCKKCHYYYLENGYGYGIKEDTIVCKLQSVK